MLKRKSKIITVLLSCVMAVSLFAGCGSNNSKVQSQDSSKQESISDKKE